ncbi:hypothetical protein E2562_034456, partial [Oryza meyeriana var. granulata]
MENGVFLIFLICPGEGGGGHRGVENISWVVADRQSIMARRLSALSSCAGEWMVNYLNSKNYGLAKSSMDFILVDYEDLMEEIKSPVQNEISDPPTGDAIEPNHNENYSTMDNINTTEPMVQNLPLTPVSWKSTNVLILTQQQLMCAKLATLVDYPESPKEIGDPNLDLTLNNITMPHTRKATEQTTSSKTITTDQNSNQSPSFEYNTYQAHPQEESRFIPKLNLRRPVGQPCDGKDYNDDLAKFLYEEDRKYWDPLEDNDIAEKRDTHGMYHL